MIGSESEEKDGQVDYLWWFTTFIYWSPFDLVWPISLSSSTPYSIEPKPIVWTHSSVAVNIDGSSKNGPEKNLIEFEGDERRFDPHIGSMAKLVWGEESGLTMGWGEACVAVGNQQPRVVVPRISRASPGIAYVSLLSDWHRLRNFTWFMMVRCGNGSRDRLWCCRDQPKNFLWGPFGSFQGDNAQFFSLATPLSSWALNGVNKLEVEWHEIWVVHSLTLFEIQNSRTFPNLLNETPRHSVYLSLVSSWILWVSTELDTFSYKFAANGDRGTLSSLAGCSKPLTRSVESRPLDDCHPMGWKRNERIRNASMAISGRLSTVADESKNQHGRYRRRRSSKWASWIATEM